MNIADTIALSLSVITAVVALARVLVNERNMRSQGEQIAAQVKKIEADVLEKYKRIASESTSELMEVSSSLRKAERQILELQRHINSLEQANSDLATRVAHLEGKNKKLGERLEEAYAAIRILLHGVNVLITQIEKSNMSPDWKPPENVMRIGGEHAAGL